eukprot:6836687-Alexandrium_andersonii.AAC.1
MSASLVGSEMCIRDRGPPDYSGASCRFGCAFDRRVPSSPHGAPKRPCAVSYTHLTLPTICSV